MSLNIFSSVWLCNENKMKNQLLMFYFFQIYLAYDLKCMIIV